MGNTPALRWFLLAVGVVFALLGTVTHVAAAPLSVTTPAEYLSRCWNATCTLALARPVVAGPLSPPLIGPYDAEVWVGTAAGEVLVTEDGGISWTLHELPGDAGAVVGVYALVPEVEGEEDRIFALDEGGRTWRFERVSENWVEVSPGKARVAIEGVSVDDVRWQLLSRTRWGSALARPSEPPAAAE